MLTWRMTIAREPLTLFVFPPPCSFAHSAESNRSDLPSYKATIDCQPLESEISDSRLPHNDPAARTLRPPRPACAFIQQTQQNEHLQENGGGYNASSTLALRFPWSLRLLESHPCAGAQKQHPWNDILAEKPG